MSRPLIYALQAANPDRTGATCPISTLTSHSPRLAKSPTMKWALSLSYTAEPYFVRSGGVKFEIKGNSDWILVLVYNVGGAGNVKEVKVKGLGSEWIPMAQNWGQNWQCSAWLVGQSLPFRVITSDGKMVQSHNVAPADWKAHGANAIYNLLATQVGACCLSIYRFYRGRSHRESRRKGYVE